MQDFIPQLLKLQETDLRLLDLAKEKKRLPEELESDRQLVAKAKAAKETQEKELQTLQLKKKEIELDIEQRTALMDKHKTQLISIKSNRDYQAMSLEIKSMEKKNSDQEDGILELMMGIEEQAGKVAEADNELKKAETVLTEAEGKIQTSIAELDKETEQLKETRREQAAQLNSGVLSVYERMFSRKAGMVVAAVEHDVCRGCNMNLTKQTESTLRKTNDIVTCEYCSRILYIDPASDPVPASKDAGESGAED